MFAVWFEKNSQGDILKRLSSDNYNYLFNIKSGEFFRWGKTLDEDPDYSPFGPEIMDIEVSEGEGCPMTCAFCYKGNKKGTVAKNMSFETFKKIFSKFPPTITQIAFGITSIKSHPELFDIFKFCRQNLIVPNVTINGADDLTDPEIENLIDLCGGIAISISSGNFEKGVNLLRKILTYPRQGNLSQINIHYVLSKQSIEKAYTLCNTIVADEILKKINAIVFLGLKPKNRGQNFDILPLQEFEKLLNFLLQNNIRFGFDSCSAPKFEHGIVSNKSLDNEQKKLMLSMSERCESGIFSAYIDADGKYWHCSFGEGRADSGGIDVLNSDGFSKIWNGDVIKDWRKRLFNLNRECPLYPQIRTKNQNL